MRKMKMTGKHFCLLLLIIPLCCVADSKNVRQGYNDTAGSQVTTRRLFARQKMPRPVENPSPKRSSEATTPVRRCSLLRESCSSQVPCCDPCASCHCRFFNIVCHCWRVNRSCLTGRKTPRARIGLDTKNGV